ncbi:MAG TPA: deoxyribonuclease IV [Thermoanaerobaculia bacterium]|nr:deoxyribonuclease IV [Thermoanaerobaculia bacterium]
MKFKPVLGAHVSVAGGVASAFGRAARLGCDAIQIFVKNANQWRAKPLEHAEAAAFRQAHAASAVGVVVAHASYLINLAAGDGLVREKSAEALADELARCTKLGLRGLVVHPGAHLGTGEETGLDRAAAALDRVLAALPRASCRLLLENTAGQGSCLGCRLEHLAAIRARLPAPRRRRVGFCIDTCHAFAAGYPIHHAAGWKAFMAEVEALLGLDALACIHLNDSLRPFASRRDRHAHIGDGQIGLDAFARFLAEPRLAGIPMILETDPGNDQEGHARDLAVLRGLTLPARRRSSKR